MFLFLAIMLYWIPLIGNAVTGIMFLKWLNKGGLVSGRDYFTFIAITLVPGLNTWSFYFDLVPAIWRSYKEIEHRD